MSNHKNIQRISDIILSELNNFGEKFKVETMISGSSVLMYPGSSIGVDKSQAELYVAQTRLLNEPFIAYVKAEVDGEEKIFFIFKGDTPKNYVPVTPSSMFVNYLAPMGKIVEGDIGDEVEFDGDFRREVYVLEKNIFTPLRDRKWDGINNSFFLQSGIYSIKSLLDFMRKYLDKEGSTAYTEGAPKIEEKQPVKKFEREFNEVIKKGLYRQIIDKMELRNQPVLDKEQGKIFRLPLSSQLIITGAPGTGKTTTMIKRIAQKSNPDTITDQERKELNEKQFYDFFHRNNWVMYTPTDLLKMFLKESFSKESVPASEETVKTWNDERIKIGRDILQFLRIGKKGIYGRTSKNILNIYTNRDLINYTESFSSFFYKTIYSNNLERIYDFIWKELYEFSQIFCECILKEFYRFILKELDKYRLKIKVKSSINYEVIETLVGQLSELRAQFNPKNLASDIRRIEDRWNSIIEKAEAKLEEIVKKESVIKESLGKKLNQSNEERMNTNREKLKKIKKLRRQVQESFEEEENIEFCFEDIDIGKYIGEKIEQLFIIRELILNFSYQTQLLPKYKKTSKKDITQVKAKWSLTELNQIKEKWGLIREINQIDIEFNKIKSKCQYVKESYVFILIEQLTKIDSFYSSLAPQIGKIDLMDKFNINTKRSLHNFDFNINTKLKLIRLLNNMKKRLDFQDHQYFENHIFILLEQLMKGQILSEDQNSLKSFNEMIEKTTKNILDDIPRYYDKFRTIQLKQDEIQLDKRFEKEIQNKKISDHEIDLLIYITLKNAHKILEIEKDWLWQNSKNTLLEEIKKKYKTLVTVDEATDFSTIQLGCMFYLSHPYYKSVSFSGDLMQRVTSFGLNDWNECKYISDSFDLYNVDKVYRQSPKLLKIAEALYEENIKKQPPF